MSNAVMFQNCLGIKPEILPDVTCANVKILGKDYLNILTSERPLPLK